MSETPDEGLMMSYRDARDAQAMVTLFQRYHLPLFRYLMRRTGSRDRAEDLAQEVFAALMDGADRYQPSGSFKGYIYRIAHNLSAKEWRRHKRRVQLDREPVSEAAPASEQVDRHRKAQALRQALTSLDADQRESILLREYEGLSYQEIATVLEVPPGTVKSRIARGKLALRKQLAAQAG